MSENEREYWLGNFRIYQCFYSVPCRQSSTSIKIFQTLTLFQNTNRWFSILYLDVTQKLTLYFRLLKLVHVSNNQEWLPSEYIKHLRRTSNSFMLMGNFFLKNMPNSRPKCKTYLISDQYIQNLHHISDQNSSKTIPVRAIHTYRRDYPPPHPDPRFHNLVYV